MVPGVRAGPFTRLRVALLFRVGIGQYRYWAFAAVCAANPPLFQPYSTRPGPLIRHNTIDHRALATGISVGTTLCSGNAGPGRAGQAYQAIIRQYIIRLPTTICRYGSRLNRNQSATRYNRYMRPQSRNAYCSIAAFTACLSSLSGRRFNLSLSISSISSPLLVALY